MVGGSEVQSGSVEDMALEELQALIPSLTISSMPGLLTLCPSRAEVLVAKEPLHQLYTVESHPFARYTMLVVVNFLFYFYVLVVKANNAWNPSEFLHFLKLKLV